MHKTWEEGQADFLDKLLTFTCNAAAWNVMTFGNIFWRKRRSLARLQGIQIALSRGPLLASDGAGKTVNWGISSNSLTGGSLLVLKDLCEVVYGGEKKRNTRFLHTFALAKWQK